MYIEFNEYISGVWNEGYWYDDGFQYAVTMLERFTDEDWKNLFDELHAKDSDWKIKLVYCLEPSVGLNGFNALISLVNDKDDEVVERVIDSLRSFSTEEYKQKISDSLEIIEKAKELLENTTSLPIQAVLKDFLKHYEKNV